MSTKAIPRSFITDVDWVGSPLSDSRSSYGYFVLLEGNLILWRSTKYNC